MLDVGLQKIKIQDIQEVLKKFGITRTLCCTCYKGMEDETWGGCEASHVHVAQAIKQMAFSRRGKAEPSRGK